MTSTMQALVQDAPSKGKVVEVAVQEVGPEWVRVRIEAVALNPTDWKSAQWNPVPGAIIGCDFTGVVEEIGSKVTSNIQTGDRIAGMIHGNNVRNPRNGAFAQHALVRDGAFFKVPTQISSAAASTFGVGVETTAIALYQVLGFPEPSKPLEKPTSILIYGASTATGTIMIQYAKLSGLTVIATASPSNFDLVKSRGADAVFDYRDPSVASQIRAATHNQLHYVVDCISSSDSVAICAEALSPEPSHQPHYASLLPVADFPNPNVKVSMVVSYLGIGEPIDLGHGRQLPTDPVAHKVARDSFERLPAQLTKGLVQPHPIEQRAGGLAAIPSGLQELADGKVSGKKLTYTLS